MAGPTLTTRVRASAAALGLALSLSLAARGAGAREDGAPPDAALCTDAARATAWTRAWTAVYGAAALGSAGVAAFAPASALDADHRAGLWVTAAKASLGVLDKIVDPLSLSLVTAGVCDEPRLPPSVRRAAVDVAARRERRAVLTTALGGLAVNALGWTYLGFGRHAWPTAWTSLGVGLAATLAATATAPTRALRADGGRDVAALPLVGRGLAGLAVTTAW